MCFRPAGVVWLFITATAITGCGRGPDEVTVHSIHPQGLAPDERAAETFGGYRVLGSVAVTDPGTRRGLAAAVLDGIARSDGTSAKCFRPRHGLPVVEGGRATDYLICFECLLVEVNRDGRREMTPTTRDPQERFDRFLAEAGVPLAPD